MNNTFRETIRQKTDKELEIISKDYVFYNEEERFIALDELERRGLLSGELIDLKRDMQDTFPIGITPLPNGEKPATKVYKDQQIWTGTFLGGPLVAGYLIAENFKAFGDAGKARKTWIYAIVATLIIFGGIFLIPDHIHIPNVLIPLLYTGIAWGLVQHF